MRVFPRPVSPKAAWRDLRSFLGSRTPHQLGFAVLSLVIPFFFLALFYLDQVPMEYRPPKIVYVQKLDPNRSDADIIAQQKIDAERRDAEEKERQRILEENRRPFKELDKKLDEWGL
ncbi:MAG: hypothetical protein RIR59_1622 [Pseudomonadota bacterium]|jgi:hypothetical protein